jgi:serine/threonine protein phosphatase PrpC
MADHEQDVAWRRHEDERWIVGDPGRQHEIVPRPAEIAASRPDTTIDGASLGSIDYRAVSLRGFSHWAKKEPRQDAYLLRISANGQWLVGCVADGVSQPKYSHMAADIACREITRHIAAALDEQPAITAPDDWRKLAEELPWQQAVDQASAVMIAKASTGERDPEHARPLDAHTVRATMATTAVSFAVAVAPAEDGQLPYSLVVAAGDSSALILSSGRWHPVTAMKNAGSDLASNAVRALPRDVQVTPITGYLPPGDALVLVTDGIGDPMGTGTGEVGQFLAAHWSRPPDLFAFASHAAFYRRGFADDRTAVAVWHEPRVGWPVETGAAEISPVTGNGDVGEEARAANGDEGGGNDHTAQRPAGDSRGNECPWFGEEGSSD